MDRVDTQLVFTPIFMEIGAKCQEIGGVFIYGCFNFFKGSAGLNSGVDNFPNAPKFIGE